MNIQPATDKQKRDYQLEVIANQIPSWGMAGVVLYALSRISDTTKGAGYQTPNFTDTPGTYWYKLLKEGYATYSNKPGQEYEFTDKGLKRLDEIDEFVRNNRSSNPLGDLRKWFGKNFKHKPGQPILQTIIDTTKAVAKNDPGLIAEAEELIQPNVPSSTLINTAQRIGPQDWVQKEWARIQRHAPGSIAPSEFNRAAKYGLKTLDAVEEVTQPQPTVASAAANVADDVIPLTDDLVSGGGSIKINIGKAVSRVGNALAPAARPLGIAGGIFGAYSTGRDLVESLQRGEGFAAIPGHIDDIRQGMSNEYYNDGPIGPNLTTMSPQAATTGEYAGPAIPGMRPDFSGGSMRMVVDRSDYFDGLTEEVPEELQQEVDQMDYQREQQLLMDNAPVSINDAPPAPVLPSPQVDYSAGSTPDPLQVAQADARNAEYISRRNSLGDNPSEEQIKELEEYGLQQHREYNPQLY